MFPILDHIDTLIASDYYEENNQPLLSEAMKLLNRPNIEVWVNNLFPNKDTSVSKPRSWRRKRSLTKSKHLATSRSWTKSLTLSRRRSYENC